MARSNAMSSLVSLSGPLLPSCGSVATYRWSLPTTMNLQPSIRPDSHRCVYFFSPRLILVRRPPLSSSTKASLAPWRLEPLESAATTSGSVETIFALSTPSGSS